MSSCNRPSEVIVCEHVNAGQPYDRLVMDDEFVGTAFCGECAALLEEALRRSEEDSYSDAQVEELIQKLHYNCGTSNICRDCARGLGIPDRTPGGEHVWARPVQ